MHIVEPEFEVLHVSKSVFLTFYCFNLIVESLQGAIDLQEFLKSAPVLFGQAMEIAQKEKTRSLQRILARSIFFQKYSFCRMILISCTQHFRIICSQADSRMIRQDLQI